MDATRGAAVTLRSPTPDDASAIAGLLNAHGRSLVGEPDTDEAQIRSWFAIPGLDPERDMRVASSEGSIVGYADIGGGHEAGEPLWIDLRVLPGEDDAARQLLATLERRAAERAEPGRALRATALEADELAQALFRGAGYRAIRSSFRMSASLDEPVEPPTWPDGLQPGAFVPGADDERVYEAHMAAFADHWSFHRQPYDEWRHWCFDEGFDASAWHLVEDGDELAAVCLCRPRERTDAEAGWISVLGVRPPWRRRGLGRALLLHAFADLRARGRRRAGLSVDAENTTGAVSLYESVGMRVVRRTDVWERAL